MAESDKFSPPRLATPQGNVPLVAPIIEDSASPDFVAQTALAGVLRQPQRALFKQILDLCADRDHEFQINALQRARALIEHTIGTTLRTGRHNEGAPILVDRLSFAWRLMQQADAAIWKLKKTDIPTPTTLAYAHGIFAPLLPGGMRVPLVQALLDGLRLGADARFLLAYALFIKKAKTPNPKDLAPPLSSALRTDNQENLRRVIWWCLRAHREQYVEIPAGEPVRIEFAYLLEAVLKDLAGWFGNDPGVEALASEVETEVNLWLTYSSLQDSTDESVQAAEIDRDIAKAFLKHNDLRTKLKIWSRPNSPNSGREAELETQLGSVRIFVCEAD